MSKTLCLLLIGLINLLPISEIAAETSETSSEYRGQGYLIANVLAGLDAGRFIDEAGFGNAFAQILIERFLNGDLMLFQLRPFLESKLARGIDYVHQMEAQLQDTKSVTVEMNGVPGS